MLTSPRRRDYQEGDGRVRTYLWLEQYDYVVILERKAKRLGTAAFLVTAFHIDGAQRREGLERKFRNRQP